MTKGVVGVILASILAAFLFAEVLLRLTFNVGDFVQSRVVSDSILGHRIPPHATGHDALGFRNRSVPQQASIVTIGDSLTYGVPVGREDSWPGQLARLRNETVYNMGLAGYGPLQYLHLIRNVAPRLKPQVVVVAFYLGNDLADAYDVAHDLPHWHGWRQGERAGKANSASEIIFEQQQKRLLGGVRDWLAYNSMVYGVLRANAAKTLAPAEQSRIASNATPDVVMPWNDQADASLGTIFTPASSIAKVDLQDPLVREGMTITIKTVPEFKAEAERLGARLLVTIIPTKEHAFCKYLQGGAATLPNDFKRVCEAEPRTLGVLTSALDKLGVQYIDMLPVFEEQVARRRQIFPRDWDAHPNAEGYGLIAREVAKALMTGNSTRR